MKQRTSWSVLMICSLVLASCGSAGGSEVTGDEATSTEPDTGSDTEDSPDPDEEEADDSPDLDASLVVWDWTSSEEDWAGYTEQVKADFAEKFPGVDVEIVIQPFDQYYTLLGNAMQTGSGPDVMMFNGGGQILDRTDALLPLNDHVADDLGRLVGLEAFTDEAGQVFGLPINLQGHPVYYNKAIYEAAGLDPETAPATWDDLVSNCETIRDNTDAHCFATGNQEGVAMEFWLSGFGSGYLTPQEYDDWIDGNRDWTSDNLRELFEAWVAFEEAGFNNPGPNSTPMFADIFGLYQAGEAAHIIGLMSGIGHWADFDEFLGPENVGAFLSPVANPNGVPTLAFDGGIGYAVAEWTEHPELAAELVRSFSSSSALQVLFNDAGMFIADTSIEMTGVGPSAVTISEAAASGSPALHVALSSESQEVLGRVGQQLLDGSLTVDEALEQLAASDEAD